MSGLNALDANVVVRSSGLKANDITLGENQLTVNLKNAVAKISLDKFVAYEGNGKGVITVNAKQTPYKISTNFSLDKIDAQPLLTDAAGFDKLMGKGSLNWNLTTTGQSQKSFINALNGKLGFEFADGAVKGANIAEMVRKAKELIKGNLSAVSEGLDTGFDNSQQTDFSALQGSFVFTNGVGENKDLSLLSPLIRITGSGKVDLPMTNVDYRLVTGIVDSIEGQGTTDDSTGFKIKCTHGTVNLKKIKVIMNTGEEKVFDNLGVLTKGMSSRSLSLPDKNDAKLDKIKLEYESVGSTALSMAGVTEKAEVEILAKKAKKDD
jgi:AsmA protein